jgi:hypothetical protein
MRTWDQHDAIFRLGYLGLEPDFPLGKKHQPVVRFVQILDRLASLARWQIPG